jgi:hypothetical protein
MLRGFFTADSGASTGAGAAQVDPQSKTDAVAVDTTAADEPKFTQAQVDTILKERLARQQRQNEAQAREAQQALEAKQLEEQAEWQKLANRRAEEVKELKPRAQLAESYEKVVKNLLEVQTRDLPVGIQTLLEKLSLVDQLDWLAANAGTIKPAAASGSTNINAYGRGAGQPQALTDEEYRARKRAESIYK